MSEIQPQYPASTLAQYARAELARAALFEADSDYEGQLGEAVMELIHVFSSQGHSGYSAAMTVELFSRLAAWKPLSRITSNPAEWVDVGGGMWQNNRQSSAFSYDGGQTWYDIDDPEEGIGLEAVKAARDEFALRLRAEAGSDPEVAHD
jgi:hypothetical protein